MWLELTTNFYKAHTDIYIYIYAGEYENVVSYPVEIFGNLQKVRTALFLNGTSSLIVHKSAQVALNRDNAWESC